MDCSAKKCLLASNQLLIDDATLVNQTVLKNNTGIGEKSTSINEPRLELSSFLRGELDLAVSPKHPCAGNKTIPVDALRSESFILRKKDPVPESL